MIVLFAKSIYIFQAYQICDEKSEAPCCRKNRTILVECKPKKDVVCIGEGASVPEVGDLLFLK